MFSVSRVLGEKDDIRTSELLTLKPKGEPLSRIDRSGNATCTTATLEIPVVTTCLRLSCSDFASPTFRRAPRATQSRDASSLRLQCTKHPVLALSSEWRERVRTRHGVDRKG